MATTGVSLEMVAGVLSMHWSSKYKQAMSYLSSRSGVAYACICLSVCDNNTVRKTNVHQHVTYLYTLCTHVFNV